MKREQIIDPEGFEYPTIKLTALTESLDGLLEATEKFNREHEPADLLAGIVASSIVLHQVLIQLMKEAL